MINMVVSDIHFKLKPIYVLIFFKEASHPNDRSLVDLRLLSEDPTTPQDTVALSNAVKTDRSSAAGATTSPVGADGSVSPNKLCPIQG